MSKPIYFYSKTEEWYELSNFYPHGFEDDNGLYWPTVEHYFQAMKFAGDEYFDYREQIRLNPSPARAKKLGQTRDYPLRDDWEKVKEEVMLYALWKKFSHFKMQVILLQTQERHLYENSPYDYYWGIGKDHQGKNRLGELLMEVRSELAKESQFIPLDYGFGCVNFRDVGEFVNFIMDKPVLREQRLFRGGKIDLVEDHSEIGFATSIVNLTRKPDLVKFKAQYFHCPCDNNSEKYNTFDKDVRRWLNQVIKLFENPGLSYPVLVHCSAGKDRTGIVIAAILKVLGIPDDVIIQEYLFSDGKVMGDWIQQALVGIGDPRIYFNYVDNLDVVIGNIKHGGLG